MEFALPILFVPEMPEARQDNISSLVETREPIQIRWIEKWSGIDPERFRG
jgi:hypothetical protein